MKNDSLDVMISSECASAPAMRMVRNKDVPLLHEIMRERIISARIMNGFTATEASKRMGYQNSTQISLIEAGRRPVPTGWKFLQKMSRVYSVSMDYLVGISPNPEIDAIAAEGFAIMRGFEELQKTQAAAMTTAFIRYGAQGRPSQGDLQELCDTADAAIDALRLMRDRSPRFDGMRGGATLLAAIENLGVAIEPVRNSLGRRKENEQHFVDLASGKRGPLKYLMDGQESLALED